MYNGQMNRIKEPNPKAIIDKAIDENRFGERLLYGFACSFVFAGLGLLVGGYLKGDGVIALAGGIASGLFWPAMREAKEIRNTNLAIRLLEDPLSRAETSSEAANTIREFFAHSLIKEKNK